MKRLELNEVIKILEEKEKRSRKEGYLGDASSYAFKRYTLLLLSKIAKRKVGKKRKPSEYNKFFAKKVKEGIPLTEISKLWKKYKEATKWQIKGKLQNGN